MTKNRTKCGATAKATQQQCKLPSGWGTDHPGHGPCKLHGGASPGAKVAAQRAMAREAVARHALDVDIDPAEALLAEVRRAAGAVAWLREQVERLDPDALVWGTESVRVKTDADGREETRTEKAAVNLWWKLYGEERDRLRAVATDAVRAGVEERLVKLAERQAEGLVDGLEWLLLRLGRADDDARSLVAEMLTALEQGRRPGGEAG